MNVTHMLKSMCFLACGGYPSLIEVDVVCLNVNISNYEQYPEFVLFLYSVTIYTHVKGRVWV